MLTFAFVNQTNNNMKTHTTILEIGHDDLVNLFSTGLYGSNYLDADYDNYAGLKDCECYEDKLAKSVLDGRSIKFIDRCAEGCVYGNLPHTILDEDEVTYMVTLEDIKKGLEKAADMGFWAYKAFADDTSNWDYLAGDALLQLIIFDDIIYC